MKAYTSNLSLLIHSLIDLLTDSLIILLSHGSGLDLYIIYHLKRIWTIVLTKRVYTEKLFFMNTTV